MAKLDDRIKDFMTKFGVTNDEIWLVPGGKSYAILHKALQRIARDRHIMITVNVVEQLCNLEQGYAVVKAFGKMGDEFCESYGEASPKNNRNQYPLAMAQKRAEDRVILGLLSVYGDVYSEEEAENFQQTRQNPHVTQPEDIFDGELDGDIPPTEATSTPRQNKYDPSILKVKDARPAYSELLKEMQRYQDEAELKEWAEARASDIRSLPGKWPDSFRIEYTKHKKSISNGKAA